MSDFVGKLMTKISASAGFPLMVYERDAKTMLRYKADLVETIQVPAVVASDIDDDSVIFSPKSVGGKNFIIYFFRWTFGGKKYVIVINDLESRVKLGRFFTVFAAVLRDMQANRDALSERVKILKENLDNKILARDQVLSELQSCRDTMAEAAKERDEAALRLKSVAAENEELKRSSSQVFKTFQDLENDLKERNQIVENLQTSIREKDETLKYLQKSINEAQNNPSQDYEAKIKQLLKVRNEAVIRLKIQMEENAKLKTSASTVEEAVRRLENSVKEKEERISVMKAEFDEALKNSSVPREFEEKLHKVTEVRNEAVKRIKELMEENSRLKSSSVSDDVLKRLQKTIKDKEDEIDQLTKTINEKNEILKSKDAKLAKTRFYLEEMTELVKVVKKSRDKIMTLTDFITVPMYSVSGERTLVHANNALAAYVKAPNVAKIVGKSCHKLIFGLDSPCQWCQLEKVQKSGTSTTVGVIVNEGDKRKNIELTIFPILDSTGTLIDCGEFIVDKTDTFELAQSLKKFKEQVMSFKRAKISGMNEIQDVKKAYDELSANYDLVVARNAKLSQALESLLMQDNNKEVMNAKNEMAEYKAALHRSTGVINNYKKNLEDLQSRYTTLNKQTFFQMERLINVVKAKQNIELKEIENMLASIGIDFNEVTKVLRK